MTGPCSGRNVTGSQLKRLVGQNRESDRLFGVGRDPQYINRDHLKIGQELLQAPHEIGIMDSPSGNNELVQLYRSLGAASHGVAHSSGR